MGIREKFQEITENYVKNDLPKRRSIGRKNGVHPSEVSGVEFCFRQDIFHQLNKEHNLGFTFSTETRSIFEAGHSCHAWEREEILGPSGVLWGAWQRGDEIVHGFHPGAEGMNRGEWQYIEPEITIEDLGMVGSIDGIIDIDGERAIIDIKSIRESGFNAVKNPNEKYVNQLHFYMEALDIRQACIYYMDKTTYSNKKMWIDFDQERFDYLKDRVSVILENRSSKSQNLPDCHSKCTPKSKMRKECMFSDVCYKVETKNQFINKEYVIEFPDEQDDDDQQVPVWASHGAW